MEPGVNLNKVATEVDRGLSGWNAGYKKFPDNETGIGESRRSTLLARRYRLLARFPPLTAAELWPPFQAKHDEETTRLESLFFFSVLDDGQKRGDENFATVRRVALFIGRANAFWQFVIDVLLIFARFRQLLKLIIKIFNIRRGSSHLFCLIEILDG